MIRGMLLLVGLVALVLTGLEVPQWVDDGRLVSWYAPVVGELMQLSFLLWLAGLVLWIALARMWWRTFWARRRAGSGVRSMHGRRSSGSSLGGADTRYLRENRLWREASDETWRNLLGGALLGLFVGFGVGMVFGWVAGLLTGVGALVIAASMSSSGNIMAAGAKGEDLAVQVIRQLPAGYTPFNQVRIPRADRNPMEADLIVVGPGVVHVIEVKHNKGEIQIRPDSPEWTVFKTGRKGGSYESSMRNPIKQVRGQVDALARYLKSQGIKQWVSGSVVLSHPEAEFQPVTHQDVAVLRLGQLVAHVQSVRRQQGASDTEAVVRAISRLIEQEDDGGPSPPSGKPAEPPEFTPTTSDAPARVGAELTTPPRRPPTLRSMTSETRYWPVGYALVLLATPWVVPGLWEWAFRGAFEMTPVATAAWTSLLVALHSSLIVWLNRCATWLWVAGVIAVVHLGLAHAVQGGLGLDPEQVLIIVSVLYLFGCAGLQFLRYEYVFGVPMVPHHRYVYEQTRPAEYEKGFERAHWLEAPDDPPFMEWEWVERKVREAEYEVIDESWGRKGDGYSPMPARQGPALTSTVSWSLIGTMAIGAILLLVMLAARLQVTVCMDYSRFCDLRPQWVAWKPGLALMGIGSLLIALSVLLRGEQRP